MNALGPTGHREILERVVLSVGVVLLFFLGYFGIGLITVPARAHELRTPLDTRIPFIAGWVWIYLWSFSASVIPLFIIRSAQLFRLTCLAFAVTIGVSLLCYTIVPVTAAHLRYDSAQLHVASSASDWAVSTVYSVDPPFNLFPSLHVSITALAALAVWKVNRRLGAILGVGLGLVVVSVCTTKQHFVLDALGGLVLAGVVGAIFLVRYRPESARATYTWRGPLSYVGSLVVFYLVVYGSYLWDSRHG